MIVNAIRQRNLAQERVADALMSGGVLPSDGVETGTSASCQNTMLKRFLVWMKDALKAPQVHVSAGVQLRDTFLIPPRGIKQLNLSLCSLKYKEDKVSFFPTPYKM